MSKQNEITKRIPLLKDDGTITEEGWAKDLLWGYDRTKIKASWLRIKEWDYYYVLDHKREHCVTCTMSDLGFAGLIAIAMLDLKEQKSVQFDTIALLTRGKMGFPAHSGDGIIEFKDKKLYMKYETKLPERRLTIDAPKFIWDDKTKGLRAELTLHQDPKQESMVIATSWKEKRTAFYYNQKINCMKAQGTVKIGDKIFEFNPDSAMAGLDWGRGRWTHKNRWYWGSSSGYLEGKPFGWNIGYGFSDRSSASENMIFYDGKAHKLDEVEFHINTKNYLEPWKFTSSDGRFEMDFKPMIDRYSKFNLGIIKSIQHQVFGQFTGFVVLDDGRKVSVKNYLGFAEDVFNKW
ncbi:MAG: DUF2804 domain-containing protein [Candidatus Heimdallarchaeota archaeon]|nr:DUF2804 domain-containing protein [Candidatus Heimdallarchaeota archaeon]